MTQTQISGINWNTGTLLPAPHGKPVSPGVAGAFAGVHNGVLIIGGGANFPDTMPWQGGKKKYHDDIFVFQKLSDGSMQAIKKTFKLPVPVAYGSSCSVASGVVCSGGETVNGPVCKSYLLKWNDETGEIGIDSLPDLPLPLANATMTTSANNVYVAGGETTDSVSSSLFVLDMNRIDAGWRPLPSLPKPVSHAVMVAQQNGNDTALYLIGGRKRNEHGISSLYSSVFAFNLHKMAWNEKPSLPHTLSAATAIASGNNQVLVFSGDRGETFHQVETVLAAIKKADDETAKRQLNEKKVQLLSAHPGFSREVLAFNTISEKWKVADSIPFEGQVTTIAVKWDNQVIIPSGEIRAGVRTPRVSIGYLNGKE